MKFEITDYYYKAETNDVISYRRTIYKKIKGHYFLRFCEEVAPTLVLFLILGFLISIIIGSVLAHLTINKASNILFGCALSLLGLCGIIFALAVYTASSRKYKETMISLLLQYCKQEIQEAHETEKYYQEYQQKIQQAVKEMESETLSKLIIQKDISWFVDNYELTSLRAQMIAKAQKNIPDNCLTNKK